MAMAQTPRDWRARRAAYQRAQAGRRAQAAALAERHATRKPGRWQQMRPWLIASLVLAGLGVLCFVASIIALGRGARSVTDALTPVGVLFIATCATPLILGLVRVVDQSPPDDRCGRCTFYRPSPDDYAHGTCMLDVARLATTSTDSCARFRYSERAMVRERLSAAPHILNSPSQA
jgi:hypothetical protein